MTNATTNLSLIVAKNVKVTSHPAAKDDGTKFRFEVHRSQKPPNNVLPKNNEVSSGAVSRRFKRA